MSESTNGQRASVMARLDDVADMRGEYFRLLLDKVRQSEDIDRTLLYRIERLIEGEVRKAVLTAELDWAIRRREQLRVKIAELTAEIEKERAAQTMRQEAPATSPAPAQGASRD